MLRLTPAQLKHYNGKDKPEMYVAVNGKIYDVTHVKQWATGSHHGHKPGTDLSEAIQHAPHKTKVLKWLKCVGTLVKPNK
ncbi:cytochrome b5 domain-containing protein [Acetilactobacillus jinshanensis]|uniref:Cytochrome B5 n=1 Tax=Acetilactobacillus jinshanensis TaxID=1720083 RepID=A0A4P6ZL85_9LACO|nr:cytochrome b5 domain-containing protein [Acetilactobacillus jinshanensis]QBP18494.1 cytochrome B5 [Acetilactobacillus jinshanensis]URL61365.1 cytochrome B5 [uncultured bacterium]